MNAIALILALLIIYWWNSAHAVDPEKERDKLLKKRDNLESEILKIQLENKALLENGIKEAKEYNKAIPVAKTHVTEHVIGEGPEFTHFTFEIEIGNPKGGLQLQEKSNAGNKLFIKKFESSITGITGGLLCQSHFQLPTSKAVYADGRWVVKISCCCEPHLNLVEKRLDEHYK